MESGHGCKCWSLLKIHVDGDDAKKPQQIRFHWNTSSLDSTETITVCSPQMWLLAHLCGLMTSWFPKSNQTLRLHSYFPLFVYFSIADCCAMNPWVENSFIWHDLCISQHRLFPEMSFLPDIFSIHLKIYLHIAYPPIAQKCIRETIEGVPAKYPNSGGGC